MSFTASPLQPFSIHDTLLACEGERGEGSLNDKPLRVLALRHDNATYELVAYTGQPFVAVSYPWPGADTFERMGSSHTSTVVHTPGGPVTSNHFSQFIARNCQAYNAGSSRDVWIDYHCINQDDTDEKMAQVAILQLIYARSDITLIMLEDVALSSEEMAILLSNKATDQIATMVRRIIAARWFTRAWCSQELFLSRRAVFFLHNSSSPGEAHRIDSDSLWQCVEIARRRDSSIPLFSLSRGSVQDRAVSKNTSWALRIVHPLECSDGYDKLSLVCNLLRHVYQFKARPTALPARGHSLPGSLARVVQLNVLKMVNVMAIARGEYSLLTTNHGSDNPLHGLLGFGWAGVPIHGDKCSDNWFQKDYEVARDPDVAIDGGSLHIRGILVEIIREHHWKVVRDGAGLRAAVDGRSLEFCQEFPTNESWTWSAERLRLRDLMTMLAAFAHSDSTSAEVSLQARIVLAYVLESPGDYQFQPEPVPGDVESLVREIVGEAIGRLHYMASALQFIHDPDGQMSFSTILLSEGSVLLVKGNAPQGCLAGQLLFQPFVTRPKLFSPPMAMTANSMVLDKGPLVRPKETYQCIGCVRGLGMSLETSFAAERRLRVV
ncbi:hypothetical protein BD309DRAFT_958691 [Dichomitus squalens]|uniref:Uncharacterized protein n=1 Tax=Dichomitus squalens TaxID=114155 RepID=A0A4Q9NRT7_9APHY|nr:hypothetical protein BD309DRAFT_958691 [Dichomitus squalens]TBU65213.1 hypothetical protein BD310DRAFT_306526 [Dichomitus squalens]